MGCFDYDSWFDRGSCKYDRNQALEYVICRKASTRRRRSHIFGWVVVVLALLLVFAGEGGFVLGVKSVVTLLITVIMVLTLIWEDSLNGYVALKRTLPGTDRSVCTFYEDGYSSVTDMGKTEWSYEKPVLLAECGNYFVFVFSNNHAQLYDKKSLVGGTLEGFREFIEDKTGKKIMEVK